MEDAFLGAVGGLGFVALSVLGLRGLGLRAPGLGCRVRGLLGFAFLGFRV